MVRNEDFQRQLMAIFQAELEEHASVLNHGLLALEGELEGQQRELLLADIFRAAHSLKGAARGVGVTDVETLAHKLEDVLSDIQQGEMTPTPGIFDALFPLVDALGEALMAFIAGERFSVSRRDQLFTSLETAIAGKGETNQALNLLQPLPSQTPGSVAPLRSPSSQEETIRVSTAKLDSLMDDVGELLVARMRSEQRLGELRQLQTRITSWGRDWRGVRAEFHQLQRSNNGDKGELMQASTLVEFLTENETQLKNTQGRVNQLIHNYAEDHNRLALLTDSLQDSVRRARMLPIATLFDSFPRMVRDLARANRAQVSFKIEGANTEVDRQVLESIKDPLVHLLRNAVDHGIQTPDLREAAGKPATGTVLLRAAQKGNTVLIEVSDDGAGIQPEKVLQAAIERGLLTQEEVSRLSDQETLNLIFSSGLSTHHEISDISGRGVGLDVVRQNLERMHGLVNVDTNPGLGTTFTLTLPLTLATSRVLLIEACGQTVAVPTPAVRRILRIDRNQIHSVEGKPAITFEDRPLPVVDLNQVLRLPNRQPDIQNNDNLRLVVLASAEKQVAFQVDGLRETQEVVVKNLGGQLQRVPNVAGATLLGSGEVVIILNVSDLMKAVLTGGHAALPLFVERATIISNRVLIVDDSITTRTLEKNILENAGYQVIVAANGQEAWGLVQHESLDIIVSDIAMPRMDGFELTEQIKADPRFEDLPVILVTSLESPQDKTRGMQAGADAYIVKSHFDQQGLLETIERLIG